MSTEQEQEELLSKMRMAVKNTQLVGEALNCIDSGLRLDDSIEGGDYWREVIRRLNNYTNAARGESLTFPDVISRSKPAKVIGDYVESNLNGPIHVYHFGGGMCGTEGLKGKLPYEWPEGHSRVGILDWDKATCPNCRRAAQEELAKRLSPI